MSNQHIYLNRGKMKFLRKEAKLLKESYITQLQEHSFGKNIFGSTDLCMTINLYHGDKRKRDIDNYCKLVLDSMNGIIFDDDSQIMSLEIKKHYDKQFPRVEIEAWEV